MAVPRRLMQRRRAELPGSKPEVEHHPHGLETAAARRVVQQTRHLGRQASDQVAVAGDQLVGPRGVAREQCRLQLLRHPELDLLCAALHEPTRDVGVAVLGRALPRRVAVRQGRVEIRAVAGQEYDAIQVAVLDRPSQLVARGLLGVRRELAVRAAPCVSPRVNNLAPVVAVLVLGGCQPTAPTRSIDELARDLAAGRVAASDALIDPMWAPVRATDEFRRLMRDHAVGPDVTLVATDEPGTPLVVTGRFTDTDGRPLAGIGVYAYHTDAAGYYSPGVPPADDDRAPRLYGFLRTDEGGRYRMRRSLTH